MPSLDANAEHALAVARRRHRGRPCRSTRSAATGALGGAHAALLPELAAIGAPVPVNRPGSGGGDDLLLRELDCAVLNFYLRDADRTLGGGDKFHQTVRGVFVEGAPAYPGASIFAKTHTQVAVRDPAVIVGYFRPSFSLIQFRNRPVGTTKPGRARPRTRCPPPRRSEHQLRRPSPLRVGG